MLEVRRSHAVSLVLLAALAATPGRAASRGAHAPNAMVVVESTDPTAWLRVVQALEGQGAHLPHRIPPSLLAGTLPPGIEARLPTLAGVEIGVERAGGPRLAGRLPVMAGAVRRLLEGPVGHPGLPEPRPMEHDVVLPLEGEELMLPSHFGPAECDRPGATSAYLVGSVAIGILMPESTGGASSEDWSNEDPRHPGEDRASLVIAEIMQGCDTLVAQHPDAALSFAYDVRRDIPIAHEAIEHSVGQRGTWIADILEEIGHGAASPSYGIGGYLHEMRERLDTDWAAAAFVIDDLNDADNGFPPTGFPFAYALLGGPYMVMTYDNDGWSLDRMDVVFRHELGHVFHALDEYRSAGNDCGRTAGWLRVKNGNNDSAPGDTACETNVACVMRGNDTPTSCAFTIGQVGMRDTDVDGVPDVRDAPPDSRFTDASPLLIGTSSVTLLARSTARALAEESPNAPVAFSINRVASAEWSLDGGAFLPLVADDAAFGGRCEDFTLDLTGLSEGWHRVELRATNDVGLLEPSPASLDIYVNADCADDASEPDDDRDTAAARPAGTHSLFHCAYDRDWSRFHLTRDASVTVTVTQSDATGSLTVRLLDAASNVLAESAATAGVATLTTTAGTSGTYYVAVLGDSELETAYDLGIAADCIDDPSEPDSPAPLGRESAPGTLRQRVLCAGDQDHYLLAVQSGQTITADARFDGSLGDIDLELIDPAGTSVATSVGTGDVETVTTTPTVEGVWIVRVFGKTPLDRNVYDLTLAATGCIDDAGENDDGAATARTLSPGAVTGIVCGDDEDWFRVTIASRRLVRIQLSHSPTAGNLDLELRDAAGTRLVARSTRPGGLEDITTERLAPGTYTVRVVAPTADTVSYRLTLEDVDPLLLFAHLDADDVVLQWNLSSQECFTVRRSTDPSDFSAAVEQLVQEGDPTILEVDRPISDLAWRDPGVATDRTLLYCYLVDPHDCGEAVLTAHKTATPYPVVPEGIGTLTSVEYAVTLYNGGRDPIFGAVFHDDLPPEVSRFSVLEIPPGATDVSELPPSGASGTGLVLVTGITVPAGEERLVRFVVYISPNSGFQDPMMDNQGWAEHGASPVGAGVVTDTDDSATTGWQDDTRVFIVRRNDKFTVHAFWHQDVDLDVQVIDTCGNVIGEHDMPFADCAGGRGQVRMTHSCTAPSPPGRYEDIEWVSVPPPGVYRIRVAYPGLSPDDPACGGRGPEEVTVVVQPFGSVVGPVRWRTVTVEPGSPVDVMTVTY